MSEWLREALVRRRKRLIRALKAVTPGPRRSQCSHLPEHWDAGDGAGEDKKEYHGESLNWMSVVLSSTEVCSQLSAVTSKQNTAAPRQSCCKQKHLPWPPTCLYSQSSHLVMNFYPYPDHALGQPFLFTVSRQEPHPGYSRAVGDGPGLTESEKERLKDMRADDSRTGSSAGRPIGC